MQPATQPQSLGAMLQTSCATYPDHIALLVPSGNGHQPITYSELAVLVRRWASGLKSLGLTRGDRLCLFAENSMEWGVLDWACQSIGVVVVPIYPTLPADQAGYIVQDSAAKLIVCGDAALQKRISSACTVRTLLLKDETGSLAALASEAPALSEEAWTDEINQTEQEDIATIIYTSGTTGNPKGAMLPHRAFIWMNRAVSQHIPLDQNDTFLSFLPLSHVFERANGHFLPISLGATIAYAKNLSSLASDIAAVQPTTMLCVPRFLQALKQRIIEGTKKQPPLQKRLFDLTLSQGILRSHHRPAPLWPALNAVVGKKIRARFGGRIRFFISGGAALPREVFDFYNAFNIPIQQGYGLTETTSGIAVNNPAHKNRPDTVGEILDGMECQIANDGEILLRGPAIMLGYHNLLEETNQAIDAEGWFHTGDVGEMDDGYLKITDRKKDILVLGNGKNVAPQRLEGLLTAQLHIGEAVVLGDGMDACVALIVPDFALLKARIGESLTDEEIAGHEKVKAIIKQEIEAVNKGLANFEMVKRHALLPRSFSIEGGELTPSMKVKRRVIVEKYRTIIETLS